MAFPSQTLVNAPFMPLMSLPLPFAHLPLLFELTLKLQLALNHSRRITRRNGLNVVSSLYRYSCILHRRGQLAPRRKWSTSG